MDRLSKTSEFATDTSPSSLMDQLYAQNRGNQGRTLLDPLPSMRIPEKRRVPGLSDHSFPSTPL
jgi:hypothetical protein